MPGVLYLEGFDTRVIKYFFVTRAVFCKPRWVVPQGLQRPRASAKAVNSGFDRGYDQSREKGRFDVKGKDKGRDGCWSATGAAVNRSSRGFVVSLFFKNCARIGGSPQRLG